MTALTNSSADRLRLLHRGESKDVVDAQADWTQSLLVSTDLRDVARLTVAHAERQLVGTRAALLWTLDKGDGWPSLFETNLSDAERALVHQAAASGFAEGPTERGYALAQSTTYETAVAVFVCTTGEFADRWREACERFFVDLRPYLLGSLANARLRASVARLQQSEKLQHALFAIADMASSDMEMQQMLRGLHRIVGELMYAENFFIALLNAERQTLRFIYFADAEDSGMYSPDTEIPVAQMEHSLTLNLMRYARPVRGPARDVATQIGVPGGGIGLGTPALDFLGVPMLRGSSVCGALVVQSYVERTQYTLDDQALLSFVGSHILTALDRRQARGQLEKHVAERTHELAEANEVLRRSERIQRAVYRIAELALVSGSMDEFYLAVHQVIGELLNARNFYIALVSDDGRLLGFPYAVDEQETCPSVPRPLRKGVTEYVLRTRRALLAGTKEIDQLCESGEVDAIGQCPESWLGVPLICNGNAVGVITVQSYCPEVRYGPDDLELLTFVSYQVASSLERRRAAEALRAANTDLERRVAERTQELREQIRVREAVEKSLQQRYADLEALNSKLAGTQSQLLQSEKMASVGQLAAGVAHEINNPIGYVHSNLTSLSGYLSNIFSVLDAYEKEEQLAPAGLADFDTIRRLKQEIDLAYLRKDVIDLLAESVEGVSRIEKIVRDLKDFSHIDQAEWQYSDIHAGLEITLNVARHELKYKADIVKEYGELPLVECLPSQLNQVFLNILVNAAQAMEGRGTITIRTRFENDTATIEISDTGKGVDPRNISRIFEPFFTTKPVGLGTGLGLSVSYGIIQKHHGTIEAQSELGRGTTFTIRLPREQGKRAASSA